MIVVVGALGTIGREVCAFLESWGVDFARRDFRLQAGEHLDLRDSAHTVAALRDAAVCVNCADYRLNPEVMRGCLAAGCHYVDLGGLYHVTRAQLDLDEEFRRAGLTAILGMGSAPGKTNLLTKAAVARLGAEPATLELWAAARDPEADGHPFPLPYSARTLLDELRMRPVVLRGGELAEVEPLAGASERELPEPIGRARGIYTLHSELATLPSAYPSLMEASFRLSLSEGLIDKLLALGSGDGDLPEPYRQSARAVAVHVAEVRDADGRATTGMTITRGGSARSTAEPAARAAAEVADGRLLAPGAHAPEAAVADAEGFLARLDTEVVWQ